jgi:hypothetical protein
MEQRSLLRRVPAGRRHQPLRSRPSLRRCRRPGPSPSSEHGMPRSRTTSPSSSTRTGPLSNVPRTSGPTGGPGQHRTRTSMMHSFSTGGATGSPGNPLCNRKPHDERYRNDAPGWVTARKLRVSEGPAADTPDHLHHPGKHRGRSSSAGRFMKKGFFITSFPCGRFTSPHPHHRERQTPLPGSSGEATPPTPGSSRERTLLSSRSALHGASGSP